MLVRCAFIDIVRRHPLHPVRPAHVRCEVLHHRRRAEAGPCRNRPRIEHRGVDRYGSGIPPRCVHLFSCGVAVRRSVDFKAHLPTCTTRRNALRQIEVCLYTVQVIGQLGLVEQPQQHGNKRLAARHVLVPYPTLPYQHRRKMRNHLYELKYGKWRRELRGC